jgi:hypothetical protein
MINRMRLNIGLEVSIETTWTSELFYEKIQKITVEKMGRFVFFTAKTPHFASSIHFL